MSTSRKLGKYQLVRQLASGGMAEVHLARTTSSFGIEKLLVIKTLLPELAANPRFVTMFLEEARLAMALHHANIVHVYDVDHVGGVVFHAMELLHGRDLRDLVRTAHRHGGRIPLSQAVAIVLSVCAGLHYAHNMVGPEGQPLGIVHRDVSPHNVFVLYDGVVKVIDFGIAKATNRIDRTATGVLKGKFGYMSPEQCMQQPLDRRSDVFSIGILLWELTTGRRLFKNPSEYLIAKMVIESDVVPPSAHSPDYPPELERIVLRALKRDRSARYDTALALSLELEAFARRAGLDLSPGSLGRYVRSLFGVADGAHPPLPEGRAGTDEDETAEYPPDVRGDPEAETRELAALDDTKSASVTETLVPQRAAGRSVATRAIALAAAVAAAGVAVITMVRRPPPAATAETLFAHAVPVIALPTAAPEASATETAPDGSVSTPPAAPARLKTPVRRPPRGAPPASSARRTPRDSDAPLPR